MSTTDTRSEAAAYERRREFTTAALQKLGEACDITKEACQLMGERLALEDQDMFGVRVAVTKALEANHRVEEALGAVWQLEDDDKLNAKDEAAAEGAVA